MTGPKLNEKPVRRRRAQRHQGERQVRPLVGLEGPRGARPHPRPDVRQRRRGAAVHRPRRRQRRSARCSPRPSPTPQHNDEQDPEELFVKACFADEGPTLQRLPPPCPWPRRPHPQAHLPHHDRRRPSRRRRGSRSSRPARPSAPPPVAVAAPPPVAAPPRRRARVERSRQRAAAAQAAASADRGDHDRRGRRGRVDGTIVERRAEADRRAEARRAPSRADDRGRQVEATPTPRTRSPRPAEAAETAADDAPPTRDDEETKLNGSEDQPVRLPPRRHHRLEEPLVLRARLQGVPDRGLEDPPGAS